MGRERWKKGEVVLGADSTTLECNKQKEKKERKKTVNPSVEIMYPVSAVRCKSLKESPPVPGEEELTAGK